MKKINKLLSDIWNLIIPEFTAIYLILTINFGNILESIIKIVCCILLIMIFFYNAFTLYENK